MEEQDRKINELRIKINYYEEENTELKNLLKDFKKEKKKIVEEKNILLNQQKDRIKQVENERDVNIFTIISSFILFQLLFFFLL